MLTVQGERNVKTIAIRIIEKEVVSYKVYTYEGSALSGVEVASVLGEEVENVYKTMVTTAGSGRYYVFVFPVAEELDLKKASKVAGEKSVEMLPQKQRLPLTGYIHGGCSPVGMKKQFATFFDSSAEGRTGFVSGGKVGV